VSAQSSQKLVMALVASHGAQLRRFLLNRTRNPADVPDLMQEVYFRMLRIAPREAIRSPEAYLFTVAHHVCLQYAVRQSNAQPPVELREMLADLAAVPRDPQEEISAQQCAEALDQALQRLSARARAAFIFYRRDGLTMLEIAQRLGVSRPMVKKYLAKAVLEFRKHLSDLE